MARLGKIIPVKLNIYQIYHFLRFESLHYRSKPNCRIGDKALNNIHSGTFVHVNTG